MKKKITLFILFAGFLLNGCATDNDSLLIKSKVKTEFDLIGFEGFESFIIGSERFEPNQEETIITDYRGLVLLTYPGGQRYPVLLDGRGLEFLIEVDMSAPTFIDAPENDFLYQFLGTNLQYNAQLRMLENSLAELPPEDAFATEINKESFRVNDELEALHAGLPNASYPMASVLLQARLLMESTYSISTIEELNERKVAMRDFISQHYFYMAHSDMLQEFGRQYMMMNEYVSQGKQKFKERIIQDIKDWIVMLEGKIDGAVVVEFFASTYYNRSMVTQASDIVHAFYDIMLGDASSQDVFHVGDTFPDFSITDNVGVRTEQLKSWDLHKVVAIVSANSKSSLAETVILLRKISEEKLFLPLVAMPVEDLGDEIISMSKLTSAFLYYGKDEAWKSKYKSSLSSLPLFVLLDKDNHILVVTSDRNEILAEELNINN